MPKKTRPVEWAKISCLTFSRLEAWRNLSRDFAEDSAVAGESAPLVLDRLLFQRLTYGSIFALYRDRSKFGGLGIQSGVRPSSHTHQRTAIVFSHGGLSARTLSRTNLVPRAARGRIDLDAQDNGTVAEQWLYWLIRQPKRSLIASSRSSSWVQTWRLLRYLWLAG